MATENVGSFEKPMGQQWILEKLLSIPYDNRPRKMDDYSSFSLSFRFGSIKRHDIINGVKNIIQPI